MEKEEFDHSEVIGKCVRHLLESGLMLPLNIAQLGQNGSLIYLHISPTLKIDVLAQVQGDPPEGMAPPLFLFAVDSGGKAVAVRIESPEKCEYFPVVGQG